MSDTMDDLADGDTSVEVPSVNWVDEIGRMANSVQIFKTNAIEATKTRDEEQQRKRQSMDERRQSRNRLADGFRGSVMRVVESVASSTTQMCGASELMVNAAGQTSDQTTLASSNTEDAVGNI
jgi:methyl-accepting chemotaxis protein